MNQIKDGILSHLMVVLSQLVSISENDREFFVGAMGNQIDDQDLGTTAI